MDTFHDKCHTFNFQILKAKNVTDNEASCSVVKTVFESFYQMEKNIVKKWPKIQSHCFRNGITTVSLIMS